MPTVEFSLEDLRQLLGKKLTAKELEDAILYAKGEVNSVNGDAVKVDIKDTNRPDLWSIEGIARELRSYYGTEDGLPKFSAAESGVVMRVDAKVEKVRPKTVGAVVKGLRLGDYAIKQLIQLQEKIHQTYGRNRELAAVGVYDYEKIKPPIYYTTVKPEGIKFIPLDFKEEMTPREILERHPKGREYGHLINKFREYPLMIDSEKNVLSLPPIINSSVTGKITPETTNVFIEITGHEVERISVVLNVLAAALAERGGRIYTVEVLYPKKKLVTPELEAKEFALDFEYCRKILGLELRREEVIKLLRKARYEARISGNKIFTKHPAYRNDVMHPRDVIEDIAIAYGLNKMVPEPPRLPTIGAADAKEEFSDAIREVMVGLGFQEVLTFSLTSRDALFKKMNLEEREICEIANPISTNWSVLRNWLLPSLLEFSASNLHVEYPHRIFEVGDVVEIDETQETRTKTIRKLACAIADTKVSYEEASSVLDALMRNLGINFRLRRGAHSSFIPGRVSDIFADKKIGVIGEIHPQVLNNWGIESPVAAFEITLVFSV